MNWKNLFSSGANMSPDEVKRFMAEHHPDEYQLVDVRQPKEYEKEHIPGAMLIPVKELIDRKDELDPSKPTFVYWHSGVRSKAAAQLLLAEDFTQVYNMSGGIIVYDGGKAVGDEAFGLELFVSGEFSDVFRMSYAMEDGLQQLYLVLQEVCDDGEVKSLLERLAKFEEGHKARLKTLFPSVTIDEPGSLETLEGGFNKQQIIDHFNSRSASVEDIIQLGMMLETQAFDLYNRLAVKEKNTESKEFFEFMANEERQHLTFLSREYDRVLLWKGDFS